MKLNLFSATYPYGSGEHFLAKEIEHLSSKFDLINLYPFYYDSLDEKKRKVPANVIVHKPVIPKRKFKRIILILKNFFYAKNKTIFFREFFSFKVYLSRKRFLSWLINFTGFIVLSANENFKKLKKEDDSIFYFYWGYGWVLSMLIYENFNSNKFYLRLHGSDVFLDRNDYYIPVRKEIFSKIDYFIPISNTVKEYLIDNFQIPEQKIIVSYLGSDFHSLNPKPLTSRFRIVSVAQLIPLKRVNLIIDILSNLDHSIEWVHFGDGFKKESIISHAKNKLPNNISFKYMGFVTNNEVIQYYKTTPIDVLINTSRYEGLPFSIIEAMSFGIPCIATSAGATSEIVNNMNGLLLPIDFDVNYVSQELSFDTKKNWFNKRKSAFNTWENKFNAQENYETLFQNLTQDSTDD